MLKIVLALNHEQVVTENYFFINKPISSVKLQEETNLSRKIIRGHANSNKLWPYATENCNKLILSYKAGGQTYDTYKGNKEAAERKKAKSWQLLITENEIKELKEKCNQLSKAAVLLDEENIESLREAEIK